MRVGENNRTDGQSTTIYLGLDVLTSLSLGQYIKASVWDFPAMTSLSVNKWYVIFRLSTFPPTHPPPSRGLPFGQSDTAQKCKSWYISLQSSAKKEREITHIRWRWRGRRLVKMRFYFTLEFRIYLELFSTFVGIKICPCRMHSPVSNSSTKN